MKTSILVLSSVSIAGLSLVAAAWFAPAGYESPAAAPQGTVTIGAVTVVDEVSSHVVTIDPVLVLGSVHHSAKVSRGPAMQHVAGLQHGTVIHPTTIQAHYTFDVEPQL